MWEHIWEQVPWTIGLLDWTYTRYVPRLCFYTTYAAIATLAVAFMVWSIEWSRGAR